MKPATHVASSCPATPERRERRPRLVKLGNQPVMLQHARHLTHGMDREYSRLASLQKCNTVG